MAIGERSFGTIGGLVMFTCISSPLSHRWRALVAAAVCFSALLVIPELALAQFTQQGPKLVGTRAVTASQGYSVALSADGNTAMVGGAFDNSNSGAAWVFTRSNGVWTQQGDKLVGTGAVGPSEQGKSVALSADGNTAIVGGPCDGTTTEFCNTGAVGAASAITPEGCEISENGRHRRRTDNGSIEQMIGPHEQISRGGSHYQQAGDSAAAPGTFVRRLFGAALSPPMLQTIWRAAGLNRSWGPRRQARRGPRIDRPGCLAL
jgi:hypothetical protein